MIGRIVNGIKHPELAFKYLARIVLDKIYNNFPKIEHFFEIQMMDRRLPRAIRAARGAGFACNVIYDIGARHGYWSEYLNRHIDAQFFLFEANEEHTPILQRRAYPFVTEILSDAQKEVTWYGTGSTGDSYYKENTEAYDDVAGKPMLTKTLDAIVFERKFPLPDFIKLDTQGSEIDILNGAADCLFHAVFVYIECSLVNYNDGAPQLTEMIAFMNSRGFVAWDIGEEHRKAGALIQLDVLFIRRKAYDMISPENAGLRY